MFEDKRLEFRVMNTLKNRGIEFIITNRTIDFNGPILSDVERSFPAIVIHDEETALRRVIPYKYGRKRFQRIIVGIDPGPKPGIAVVGDGYVVEKMQLSNTASVRKTIDNINKGYSPAKITIRVGNGDIVNRNKIVNSLVDSYDIELVNEKNTTTTITNRDPEAAKNIAFSRGKRIHGKINTIIREGYLRDIQRKSRIESEGRITISRELAKKVAMGEISLNEAIKITRVHK